MGHVGRRHTTHTPPGNPWLLAEDHPAAVEGRTRYPKTRKSHDEVIRVLKSGKESRKIGDRVVKGRWKGMPIFTLTLEERATCPRSCLEWLSCYGNKMHFAHRFRVTPELMKTIAGELAQHQRKFPGGFVVRLHVLGDFPSVSYVEQWREWMFEFPALHIFGYTANGSNSLIGRAVRALGWERAAVRFSGEKRKHGAVTVIDETHAPTGSIVCPAQTNKTDCCGTCGLCWGTERLIAFLRH